MIFGIKMVDANSLESLGQELFNDVFKSGNYDLVSGCIDAVAEVLVPQCSTEKTRNQCRQIVSDYFKRYISDLSTVEQVCKTVYGCNSVTNGQAFLKLFINVISYVGQQPVGKILEAISDYDDAPYEPKVAVPWLIGIVVFKTRDVDLVDKTVDAIRACRHHLASDESYETADWVTDDSTKLSGIIRKRTNKYDCSSPVAKDLFMKELDEFCVYLAQKKK